MKQWFALSAIVVASSLSACATVPETYVTPFCRISNNGMEFVGQSLTTEFAVMDITPHGLIAVHPDCPDAVMAIAYANENDDITRKNLFRVSSLTAHDYWPLTRALVSVDQYPAPPNYPDAGQPRPILKVVTFFQTTYPEQTTSGFQTEHP